MKSLWKINSRGFASLIETAFCVGTIGKATFRAGMGRDFTDILQIEDTKLKCFIADKNHRGLIDRVQSVCEN